MDLTKVHYRAYLVLNSMWMSYLSLNALPYLTPSQSLVSSMSQVSCVCPFPRILPTTLLLEETNVTYVSHHFVCSDGILLFSTLI